MDEVNRSELFDRLERGHSKMLRFVIRRSFPNDEDVEEILQRAWTKAWQYLHTLRNEQGAKGWLLRIAQGTMADYARENQRARFRSLLDGNPNPDVTADDPFPLQLDPLHWLVSFVKELPRADQDVLQVGVECNWIAEEMARKLRWKDKTVRSAVSEFRHRVLLQLGWGDFLRTAVAYHQNPRRQIPWSARSSRTWTDPATRAEGFPVSGVRSVNGSREVRRNTSQHWMILSCERGWTPSHRTLKKTNWIKRG